MDLARRGVGRVRTNPLVGALLVYRSQIIGEGYHARFGGPHAEVNAFASVAEKDRSLIRESTLYVTLEPCCTFGKTPPCSDLILRQRIPRVVVSCLDPSPQMNGRSLALLESRGVEVTQGVLENEGRKLLAPFTAGVCRKRPYIILKYAKSRAGFMAPNPPAQHWITDELARRLVHKWRSEVDAILVGYQTGLADDPSLTTRHYFGPSPLRIVLDPEGALPAGLRLFQDGHPTWRVINPGTAATQTEDSPTRVLVADSLPELLAELRENQVGSLLVEGGARTLRRFLSAGLWDEARVLTGPGPLDRGVRAPLPDQAPTESYRLGSNRVEIYTRLG